MDAVNQIRPIEFLQIHEIVLGALDSRQIKYEPKQILQIVGEWFYKFLNSKEERLSLKVPYFSEDLIGPVVEYLTYLDLLTKLLQSQRPLQFEGTALFDFFRYNHNDKSSDCYLRFDRSQNSTLFFGEDTIVSQNRLLPVFKYEQLNANFNNAIDDAFHLFTSLASSKIVNRPILIDVQSNLSLWISKSLNFGSSKLLSSSISSVSIKNDDELGNALDELESRDIKRTIICKYPFHSNIDSRIYSEFKGRSKQFEVTFKTRLYYDEISKDDIVLVVDELGEFRNESIFNYLRSFKVVATSHSAELYLELQDLKSEWRSSNFNRYKNPFPAKWFMCIHQKEELLFWKNQYQLDFPEIKGILLSRVLKIIELLYELNWSEKYLQANKSTVVMISRSNLFREVLDSFKTQLSAKFQTVEYLEEAMPLQAGLKNEVIILDSFNTLLLSNIGRSVKEANLNVVTPDFLYYNHQPFVKYHIAKYQYEALINGSRSLFDQSHSQNLKYWTEQRAKLLKEIVQELNSYRKNYLQPVIAEPRDGDLALEENEDSILLEEEVIDLISERERSLTDVKSSADITVKTDEGNEFILKPNSKVLIEEKGYILNTRASVLKAGMYFLPLSEVSRIVVESKLEEKMASIPKNALSWKQSLYSRHQVQSNLFRSLENQGLSITERTFNNDWLNQKFDSNDEFHLPRSFRDWKIVCDYLKIDEVAEAWRFHKCHGDLRSLKRAYSELIVYLNDESNYGFNVDTKVLEKVAEIFELNTGIKEDPLERLQIAKSVIIEITKRFDLQKIVHVK